MRFDLWHFDELTAREVYDLLHLRDLVFVVGQKITSVAEVDGLDPQCAHARAFLDEKLVGTVRVFVDARPLVVGRVAVHPDHQGNGIGTAMMEFVQGWLGARTTELPAQAHLEPWYTRLGWTRVGDPYIEADIPHVTMRWN